MILKISSGYEKITLALQDNIPEMLWATMAYKCNLETSSCWDLILGGQCAGKAWKKPNISTKQPSLLCSPGSLNMKSFHIRNHFNTESKSLKHTGGWASNDKILKRNMNSWALVYKLLHIMYLNIYHLKMTFTSISRYIFFDH